MCPGSFQWELHGVHCRNELGMSNSTGRQLQRRSHLQSAQPAQLLDANGLTIQQPSNINHQLGQSLPPFHPPLVTSRWRLILQSSDFKQAHLGTLSGFIPPNPGQFAPCSFNVQSPVRSPRASLRKSSRFQGCDSRLLFSLCETRVPRVTRVTRQDRLGT